MSFFGLFRNSSQVTLQVQSTDKHVLRISMDGVQPITEGREMGGFYDLFRGTASGKHFSLQRCRSTGGIHADAACEVIKRETQKWERLHHENLLQFVGVANDSHNFLYLIWPWMERGSLQDYIKANPHCNRPRFVLQVARALSYLHRKGLVHGSVRARNVLISSTGDALLCDYGLATIVLPSSGSVEPAGEALRWDSPELGENPRRTTQSDVYAFGMTTYEILSGHLPLYQYRNLATLNRGVIERQEKPPKEPERSPLNFSYMPLWEIAEACWSDDPGVRPTLASILPRLESEATMAARKGTSLPQIHRVPMRVPSITRSSPPSPNRQPPAPKRNAITFAPGITDYTNRLRHRTFTVGSPLLSELARVYEGELGGNQPVSFAVVRRPSGDNLRAASSEDKQAMEKLIKRAWYDWEKVASGHGIIPYMGYAFLDESVCLITDSTQERPILQFLNAGRTADRLHLLRQAAEALCFLHSRQPEIVHGDVSDVNVMVNTHGEAMLRNFGLWTLLGNKEGQGDDANPDASQYTAPEVLADGTFTTQGDVFSFGRLALEVLTLEPGAPKVPDALWNTLNSCWEYVPDERPELDDILKEESVSSSSSVSSY